MTNDRALSGVKVVELATFIAGPSCTRFLADQGADVIKVENLVGDGTRHAGINEARPDLLNENLTFDLENGNKRGLSLNLKNPECLQVLMKLLAKADIFITSWRPKSLAKMGLDYESLKEKFPALVYGTVTGYGENGPDKDLPGYDFTAFFARSGILGSLYEKGTVPMNLIPSLGDRQVGMCLTNGVLAALYRAAKTGQGEKISVSLLGTAIFMQGTMIQTAQYGLITYPITHRESPSPLINVYKTKDRRFIQVCMPMYNMQFPAFAKAMDKEAWLADERFTNVKNLLSGPYNGDLYDAIAQRFAELTAAQASEKLTKADLPFAVAQVWSEVLKDPQAWANDFFLEMEYESGKRTLVRPPVQFKETGPAPYNKAPRLGQHTAQIMKELGYTEADIKAMQDSKDIIIDV